MALHGLTIFVNVEQRPLPPPKDPLIQERIDQVLRRPIQRMANNVVDYGQFRLTYINGSTLPSSA